MRQLPKYWFPCLLALMLPAACAPARVATNAPERLLLKRATKVFTLPKDGCHTYWIGTNTLLLITNTKRNLGIPSKWKGKVERLDTRTGSRQTDFQLTAMLNSLHMEPQDCEPSPNGKWLLWQASDTLDHNPVPFTSTSSGQKLRHWRGNKILHYYWIDKRRWVAEDESYRENPRLYVQNVQTLSEQDLPAYSAQAQATLSTKFLCGGLQYSAVYNEDKYTWPNPVTIVLCDRLHAKFAGSRNHVPYTSKYVIALPKQMFIENVDIAPNTNRVLYQVEYTTRQIPVDSHRRSRTFAGLWTSGVDGSGLHEIGHVELKDKDGSGSDVFRPLQWLPDGRHIGFKFRSTVYKIAAD